MQTALNQSADRRRFYISILIEELTGNDVHKQPEAKRELKAIVTEANHTSDCESASGRICNCGLREATMTINAEV